MPIYEYRCTECGFEKEYLQKASDPRITACPSCGRPTFVKKLTSAGFHLKGSGWYATDFKNQTQPKAQTKKGESETKTDAPATAESSGKDAAAAKSDAPAAEAKPEAKQEAKPEAKKDTKGQTKSDAPASSGSSSS